MDYSISLASVFWLVGGIAAIIALIRTLTKPFSQLDDHERRIHNLEDEKEQRQKTDDLILRSLNAMMNHMIDGNGVEEMKAVRKEFQDSALKSSK